MGDDGENRVAIVIFDFGLAKSIINAVGMNRGNIHSRLKRRFERPFEKAVEIVLLYSN
jgi:hypothetical protein